MINLGKNIYSNYFDVFSLNFLDEKHVNQFYFIFSNDRTGKTLWKSTSFVLYERISH